MDPQLVRNCLKVFVAVLITAAIASWSERVTYLWYPLMAVILVVDDNDDLTVQAAAARILGTVMGGLVTFLVHTLLAGWMGVLVSLLLMGPVLRLFGWQAGMATAGTLSVMFLMLPGHEALNWTYVFNRAVDTGVGCAVALGVGLLFWPRDSYHELNRTDAGLRRSLGQQLDNYGRWLQQQAPRPAPLDPAPLSAALERMELLVQRERGGPHQRRLRTSGWERRLRLWQQAQFHWVAWERLLAGLPALPASEVPLLGQGISELDRQLAGASQPTPRRNPRPWQELAQRRQLPLLPLLALVEEQRPLHASLGALGRSRPC